jgi:uncharacterized protein (DUF362 family)/Pyruvate/2-oxoacid:ferredoxin oxidoreductase delta subunit
MSKVSLVKCPSYNIRAVSESIETLVNSLGGIEKFVKHGERILIKPNLLSPKAPSCGVTTHPEIVRQIVKLVKSAGATPIIGDSPGGAVSGLNYLWQETGMYRVAEEEGVELVSFETAGSFEHPARNKFTKTLRFTNVINEVDGIINVPKLKTHSLMYLTAAVKNFFGTIPGLVKGEYHKLAPLPQDFAAVLGDIYAYVKPKVRLSIVDAVVSMDGPGPSDGNLKDTCFLAGSSDACAIDVVMMEMLGGDFNQNHLIKILKEQNLGETDISKIELTGNLEKNLNSFVFPSSAHPTVEQAETLPKGAQKINFSFPNTKLLNMLPLPKKFISFIGRFVWVKPYVKPAVCVRCLLCLKSCPVKAIEISKSTKKPSVIKSKCISCYCCHEFCQYHAIGFKFSLLARFFIKEKKAK